jgi:hypothetical protein
VTATRGGALPRDERTALLDREVTRWVRRGYRVVARTPTTAQLRQPKTFSLRWFVCWSLLVLVPGLLYVLWYRSRGDRQVDLEVDERGRLHRTRRGAA